MLNTIVLTNNNFACVSVSTNNLKVDCQQWHLSLHFYAHLQLNLQVKQGNANGVKSYVEIFVTFKKGQSDCQRYYLWY